jgi:hypothetical protein
MDEEKKIPGLSLISSMLAGINLIVFIYLIFMVPNRSYNGFAFCFMHVMFFKYFLGWLSLIIIPVIFLSGIAANFIKQYRLASTIFLLGGFITFPVGVIGIVSSLISWSLSALPRCPVCKYPLEEDWDNEGKYLCPNCRGYFGMIEMEKKY